MMILPPFFTVGGVLLDHLAGSLLAEHKGAGEVGGKNLGKIFGGVFLTAFPILNDESGGAGDASIVDEDVQLAKLLYGLVDDHFDVLQLAGVCGDAKGAAAFAVILIQIRYSVLYLGSGAGGDYHIGAVGCSAQAIPKPSPGCRR